VVTKRVIVDTLDDLASLASLQASDGQEAAVAATWEVCHFWGELGLRCLCTSDERTRDVGLGLLEGLTVAQPRFPAASLKAAAEHALAWLQDVCGHVPSTTTAAATPAAEVDAGGVETMDGNHGGMVPGTEGERLPSEVEAKQSEALAKRLDACGLKDGDKLEALFLAVHQVLLHVGSLEGASQMPALWYGTALRCLRCVGKYPVREMGLVLVQDAIQMQPNAQALAYARANARVSIATHTQGKMMTTTTTDSCEFASRLFFLKNRKSKSCLNSSGTKLCILFSLFYVFASFSIYYTRVFPCTARNPAGGQEQVSGRPVRALVGRPCRGRFLGVHLRRTVTLGGG